MTAKNPWPTRADGTNKTVGEMTPDERRAAFAEAAERVKQEMESPEMQRAVGDYLNGRVQ